MCKRLAWLWLAALLASGAIGNAAGPKTPVKTAVRDKLSPAKEIKYDVSRGIRPPSMNRMLAPNDFPTNIVKILRTTNKAQTNTYVPVVFTFKNTNPFNVVRFLIRPTQLEAGTLFTFVNPDNTGGKVMFVVPEYMVESLKDLVATIDRKDLTTSAGDLRVYRQLNHRRADPSDPGFLASVGSFNTGDEAKLIADPEENALYYEDAPSGSQSVSDSLTQWLDVPTAMLEMVVKIYEVDATNDTAIGLDYTAWKNGPGANLFATGAFAEHGSLGHTENPQFDPIGSGASGVPKDNFSARGYNYAFRYDVPSSFFDFLVVKGKARVMNEMKLAALNTRPASLSAGDQVLYYAVETSDPSGIRNSGAPFQANGGRVVVGTTNTAKTVTTDDGKKKTVLTPVETGLSLDILPTIGEQTVKMDLKLKWSDYTFPDDTGIPQISDRKLATTLRAKLGDEFIIGGLSRQVEVKSSRKVPILGSLPLIGYAFGGETTNTKKSEIVVVIHPTAVFNYDIAKDYVLHGGEQQVIDKASGKTPIVEPKAGWGTDMPGLDRDACAKAVETSGVSATPAVK